MKLVSIPYRVQYNANKKFVMTEDGEESVSIPYRVQYNDWRIVALAN